MEQTTEETKNAAAPRAPEARELIAKMFGVQYALNTKSYDSAWIERGRSEEFDYLMAAGDEAHEFLRSLPFQWWTKDKADRQNQVTEVVDAWHFVMSQFIIDKMTIDTGAAVTRASEEAYESYERISYYGGLAQTVKRQAKVFVAACYAHNSGHRFDGPSYIDAFFQLCAISNISVDLLYARYVAKATLNKFRVANGYKQGTYQKIWQLGDERGEDNYFLSKWVDGRILDGVTPSEDEVTNYLMLTYPAVVQAMQPAA